jgi:hypothetical protein
VNTYRFGGKLIAFADVDVGTTIEKRIPGQGRLPLMYVVRAANTKSLAEINWELRLACRMNPADDPTIKMRRRLIAMPGLVRRAVFAAMARNPFWLKRVNGTMGLTNLQRRGLDRPFFALPPNIYTLTMAVGPIVDRFLPGPDRQPVPRRIVCLSAGADHAVIDGMDMVRFYERLTQLLESASGLGEEFAARTRELRAGSPRPEPAA